MRPGVVPVFQKAAQDLLERVIPAIGTSYQQGTAGMIASMLAIVSEEWDRAASRRIEENQRIRELFRDYARVVNDAALKRRVLQLAESREQEFHISSLEKNNCALRAALIELHAHVESRSGADARKVEDEIWNELVKSTERRRLSTAAF